MARNVPSPACSWWLSYLTATFAYTHLLQKTPPRHSPAPGPHNDHSPHRQEVESPGAGILTTEEVGDRFSFFTDIFCGSFPVKVTGKLAQELGSADSLPEKCTQE